MRSQSSHGPTAFWGELDAVTRGGIGQLIDALILPETDVLRPFAFTVAYAGLLLDLIAPSLLFYASRPSARTPRYPACRITCVRGLSLDE